jgi:uncharacterized protein DUF6496
MILDIKESDMAKKYGKKASEKVGKAMHERKAGTLRSSSGKKVTSRKQAIAIGLSQARAAGGKVPPPKKSSARRTSSHTS